MWSERRPRTSPAYLTTKCCPRRLCPQPSKERKERTDMTDVVMPQMGESIVEGTLTKWLKKAGERVERDEPLFEISTDKVDAEIPSPAAGVLTEIKFKEGDTVEVNKVIAVLDGEGAGAAASAQPQPAATSEQAGPPAAAAEEPAPVQETAQAQEAETPAPASLFGSATATEKPAEPVTAPKVEAPAAAPVSQAPTTPPQETKTAPPQPQRSGDGRQASVEDLRRTKSSPLVRKIATEP